MRLSYRTAGRIAWRETRSSMTKFLFVVLAVAAGVGALAGVQGFSAEFPRDAAGRIAHRDGGRSDGAAVYAGRRSRSRRAGCAGKAGRGAHADHGDGLDGVLSAGRANQRCRDAGAGVDQSRGPVEVSLLRLRQTGPSHAFARRAQAGYRGRGAGHPAASEREGGRSPAGWNGSLPYLGRGAE